MATTASRINNTGTYFINGNFDEITGTTVKVSANTVYARSFDEVTYSSTTPAIKNLLRYTEQFDNSFWYKGTSSTVTANASIAPDGTITADKLIQTTTNERHGLQSSVIVITANTPYTLSLYAKAAENNFVVLIYGKSGSPYTRAGSLVNLTTGAITNYASGSVTSVTRNAARNVGNGWWRISVTITIDATSTDGYVEIDTTETSTQGAGFIGSNNTNGIYIWGAQLEQNSTATIYQGVGATNTLVPTSFIKREDNTGSIYVKNIFDEFTGAPIVDSSLVLWVDSGQSTSYSGSGTTLVNLINPSINGTLTNSPTYNASGSFLFNGTNQYITFGDNLDLIGSDISGSIWVNLNSYDATFSPLIDKLATAGNYRFLVTPSGTVSFGIRGSDNTYTAQTTPNSISIGVWHNLAFTFEGTAIKIYINGTLAVSGTLTATTRSNTSTDLKIGYSFNNARYLNGSVSQAQIYSRALTADEVSQNFNALRRRYGI
jgi:hypothetical protein